MAVSQVRSNLGRQGDGLPPELGETAERIERSRAMLDLPPNWDGEGSSAYDSETWREAVGVVVDASLGFWKSRHEVPPAPWISKGPEGSVDILWRRNRRKILINVPFGKRAPITFYGNDLDNDRRVVEGSLDPAQPNAWLVGWLTG